MKIAYLFEQYPSPTETFLAREVEALRLIGFEIEIFALTAGEGATAIEVPPRALKLLGKDRFWRQTGRRLALQLKLKGVEHVHATWANHITQLALATADAAALPWSFAAHARDLWVEGGDLKAKLASARFAVTCTQAGAAELRRHGPNVLYAPHGIEIRKYKFQRWKPRRKFRAVGVGRLVEKKGWPDALEAIEQINQGDGDLQARFVLIGDGPLRRDFERAGNQLVREWKRMGLSSDDDLRLHGALPHAQTIKVMRRCHCCVLPSRQNHDGDRDGLANVLLEAAALGLPIISTTAGSAADFVDESTGMLVEPGNPQALAAAISDVFNFPEATTERCRNARARVEADFEIQKNVLPLAQAFRSGGIASQI